MISVGIMYTCASLHSKINETVSTREYVEGILEQNVSSEYIDIALQLIQLIFERRASSYKKLYFSFNFMLEVFLFDFQ